MHCPICHNILQQLEVTTNHGKKFSVDHCGRCGGTWFDPYQIHRIPFHEVVRLAHITVLPKIPRIFKDNLLCPLCHKTLEPLQVDGKPAGTQLMKCHRCSGIWATQKALEMMEEFQSDTQSPPSPDQNLSPFRSVKVMFAPVLFLVVFLYATFLTVSSLQQTQNSRIYASSQILSLKVIPQQSGSVFISFQTDSPVQSEIQFGLSLLELSSLPISVAPQTNHQQFIQGLNPNTTYIYRIRLFDNSGNSMNKEEEKFITI